MADDNNVQADTPPISTPSGDTPPQPSSDFLGDAEAVLATSKNADMGIKDLVDAYKSTTWDKPEEALSIVQNYADKLRQKTPGEQNLLTPEKTLALAPVQPKDVNGYIEEWKKQNLAKVADKTDPTLRAYQATISDAIKNTAVQAIQEGNTRDDSSEVIDKIDRMALGTFPGLAKMFGVENQVQRKLRSDSNDTLTSAVAQASGSVLSLPLYAVNVATNPVAFGYAAYQKSRAAGASVSTALESAGIEAATQGADAILSKMILGGKVAKEGAKATSGFVLQGLKRSGAEGAEQYVRAKFSELADFVGLNKEDMGPLLSNNDLNQTISGAIIGGASHIGREAIKKPQTPPPANGTTPDSSDGDTSPSVNLPAPVDPVLELAKKLGIGESEADKDSSPQPTVAVVGEPVHGANNLSTIKDSPLGEVTNTKNIVAESDQGEQFIQNEDGTTARIVNGDQKQAHENTTLVSEDTAHKVASLQAAEPQNSIPIIPKFDDLGRPYISHPNVNPDLTFVPDIQDSILSAVHDLSDVEGIIPLRQFTDEEKQNLAANNLIQTHTTQSGETFEGVDRETLAQARDSRRQKDGSPVMIPPAKEGEPAHVLQQSSRINEFGTTENSTTVSKGKVTGTSTAGAQAVKESSVADKLRQSSVNPQVKNLLGLDEDFSSLTYVPTSNNENLARVNEEFAKYDNNHVAFADALSQKEYADITPTESVAAGFAANALSDKAESIRETEPEKAAQYDVLSAKMWAASQAVGSSQAQDLQARSIIPISGSTILSATRSELGDRATAQVAEEQGMSVQQVENVQKENAHLDTIDEGLNTRQEAISEQEKLSEERAVAPDKAVEELEKAVKEADTQTNPEVEKAQKAVDEADAKIQDTEKKAVELEKEADALQQEQAKPSEKENELQAKLEETKKEITAEENPKVKALEEKLKTKNKEESPAIKTAKEKVANSKTTQEKAAARLELTKALEAEKTKGHAERKALEDQIRQAKEDHKAEQDSLKQKKQEESAKIKEQLRAEKETTKKAKQEEIAQKRKDASDLRANTKLERAKAKSDLIETKKRTAEASAETKRALKEKLAAAKEEKQTTAKLRKEQLDLERQKIKQAKEALNSDREKVNAQRERNKHITDTVAKYKKEFTDRLTPDQSKKIQGLVDTINNSTGNTRKLALDGLGRLVAKIKGVPLAGSSNPLSTFWKSNVLSSIGTSTNLFVGSFVTPIRQVLGDLYAGKPGTAYKFVRGFVDTLFSSHTLESIQSGHRGELPNRREITDDKTVKESLKELTSGITTAKESDPVRLLKNYFEKGVFGRLKSFLSSPAFSLRYIGAMDAVFAGANKAGRLAREAPSYADYLKTKASDYNKYIIQARNEETQLQKLGVDTPKNFANMRADELSFEARPKEVQDRINKGIQNDQFHSGTPAKGFVGSWTNSILKGIGNSVPAGSITKDLNAKQTVATAIGLTHKHINSDIGVNDLYPLITEGLSSGKTLVINGQEVKNGSTKELLTNLVDAVNNKQLVSLQGESIKPLKYMVGMFTNTASRILDFNMAAIPGLGVLDKRLGDWKGMSVEEKQQLYGTQIASTVLTSSLLYALGPHMDDEEHASFYIYGGMVDPALRKIYEAKGIKPFSVRFGSITVEYKDIPGLSLLFGGIGGVADAHMVAKRTPDRPLSIGSSIEAAAVGSLYVATHASLLKNLGVFADTVTGLIKGTDTHSSPLDVLNNMASGLVPFSGAGKELERFVYGDLSRPRDVLNKQLQNIPFAKFVSENEPALNMFGEPINSHIIPGLNRFIGESKTSPEADWMLKNGYTVHLPKPVENLTKKESAQYADVLKSDDPENFEPYLSEKDNRAYLKQVGPALKGILQDYSSRYPQGHDDDVQKELNTEVATMKAGFKNDIINPQ